MKGRLLTSLITMLTFTGLQAQTLPASPKLVVGLTIDQLRTDYLEAFSALYGERGFKRLLKEGRVYRNAEFDFIQVDRASSIASVYTGTVPATHGIISENWLDYNTLRVVNCVDDPDFMGIYTAETTSASQILTSTLTDELKVATQGKAIVYSIAPYRDAAVLSAGHAADGAFWLNDDTGKWCGTTYYSEFPAWVSLYNDCKGLDFRIGSMVWKPYYPAERYTYLPTEWKKETFSYDFDDFKRNKYRRFKVSPYVNEEVNDLVSECLASTPIGADETPDLLSVTFYAGNYDHKNVMECSLEMQDTYARLDRSIASLLDMIDRKVGLQNTLFFITSTGYSGSDAPDLAKYRIPGGEFHIKRCAALLNMYLMALYGEGQYVEAYHDLQIYLNRKLIENKQLDLKEILERSSEFLVQFSGVDQVYSSYRLLLGAWNPQIQKYRNSYNRFRSGDLRIEVLPGWTIVRESPFADSIARKSNVPFSFLFLGYGIKPEIIHTPVDIDRIAPTLSHFLRIRAPNACSAMPLIDMCK